ncbi:hypothetical protein [Ureibacillus acetophenoni]|uniref:hypothetical protein n=1 Tax=Ureibacillus acetophenoni TaxID=614649 RepID=UPI001483918E|nr:hypothetical protein [Ureibacillus acetophenoni]
MDLQESQLVQIDGTTFKAPSEKGSYYYLYFGRWDDNGTGTAGDSSCGFIIEVE